MGRGSRKEAAEPRTTSEDGGWGGGLGRGGKGAAGEGDAQRGEKIGQRPQLLSDFRFQFQREKVGTKGVSLRLQEVRTLREGLGEGFRGSGTCVPLRPGSAQQSPALGSAGTAAWRTPARQEAWWAIGAPGWWKAVRPSLPSPSKGDLGTWDGLVAWFNQPGSGRPA